METSQEAEKSTMVERYRLIHTQDIDKAQGEMNAFARDGYKFIAFQSGEGGSLYILMEIDIAPLMDEIRGAGGFLQQAE